MSADSRSMTYASGGATPFAYIEVQDLDGTILGICHADASGQWSIALQGAVPWIQIQSHESKCFRTEKIANSIRHATVFDAQDWPHLSISCDSRASVVTVDTECSTKKISGHTNAAPGQPVMAMIGKKRLFTITRPDGSWAIPFCESIKAELGRGIHDVCVTVTDRQGNEAIVWDTVAFA